MKIDEKYWAQALTKLKVYGIGQCTELDVHMLTFVTLNRFCPSSKKNPSSFS